jgi:hypothetical protein
MSTEVCRRTAALALEHRVTVIVDETLRVSSTSANIPYLPGGSRAPC